ncbi:4055_t:CDS:2 [Paraglomus occultum]|uniref:4055_t:CDS:1 n=1 Tax=Paraglomus occultum TaxID=144539 RepID=A0A9N9BXP2_9GLOM|nr:4055_t:CDS:2 [Paraglomus occultum]
MQHDAFEAENQEKQVLVDGNDECSVYVEGGVVWCGVEKAADGMRSKRNAAHQARKRLIVTRKGKQPIRSPPPSHIQTDTSHHNTYSSFTKEHRRNNVNEDEDANDNETSMGVDGETECDETFGLCEKDEQMIFNEMTREDGEQTQRCCLCGIVLRNDIEYVNQHIDVCLENYAKRSRNSRSSPTYTQTIATNCNNVSGEYEEYTWAGQTRVRTVSLVEGGWAALRLTPSHACSERPQTHADHDEILNVDVVDDEHVYGRAQYTESDIIQMTNISEDEVATRLRELVVGGRRNGRSNLSNGRTKRDKKKECDITVDIPADSSLVEESLKARIRQLESQTNIPRCLICLDTYDTPLTSIICWHVHCEKCWLQSLGVKKVCPQCQKITLPGDLRRVYI